MRTLTGVSTLYIFIYKMDFDFLKLDLAPESWIHRLAFLVKEHPDVCVRAEACLVLLPILNGTNGFCYLEPITALYRQFSEEAESLSDLVRLRSITQGNAINLLKIEEEKSKFDEELAIAEQSYQYLVSTGIFQARYVRCSFTSF